MAPEKIIDYDKQFTSGLDEARNKIDFNTIVGKNLDNLLTPLFKRYGFIDRGLVCINPSKIAEKDRPFKHSQTPNVVLAELGCDMKWFEHVKQQNDLPIGHKHEISELINHHLKAQSVLQKLIKTFHFENHNTALNAFDIYAPLHWITTFAKELDKLKHESKDLHMMHENELVEALQKLIYHRPKKVEENINQIAEQFNVDIHTIKDIFEKKIGVSVREYSTMVLNEGLGDYVKHAVSNAGNKFTAKYGFGQSKVAAKAKLASSQDMNNVLNHWTELTHGDAKAATPDALKNFLVRELSMDPAVVDASLKKFSNSFVGGTKNTQSLASIKAQNQNQPRITAPTPAATPAQSAPIAQPVQPAPVAPMAPATPAKPKITPAQAKAQARKELGNFNPEVDKRAQEILAGESIKKKGKQINEDYLPKNSLRDFFLDAIKTQKQSILGNHIPPATQAPAVAAQTYSAPQVQPTQFAPTAPAAPTPQAPASPVKSAADFAKSIGSLPANQRAAAISQALATLDDEEIKQVLNVLLTPKKK